LLLAACGDPPLPPPASLGKLVVATRETPVAYHNDGSGRPSGLEHDLVALFAEELGLEVRFIAAADPAAVTALLRQGRAHFAAAGITPAADGSLRYTPPIRQLRQVVVGHEDGPPVEEAEDLRDREIVVMAASPQLAALRALQPAPPGMRLVELQGVDEMDLLQRVSERRAELAAVDADHFAVGANFFPAVQEAVVLPGAQALVWAFPPGTDDALLQRAGAFIGRVTADGTLTRLADRYLGHVHRLTAPDIQLFLQRMRTILPRYRKDFTTAQDLNGIDWRLLAALAYQESHWRPDATSPTNVRGMMMLTEDTADRLRVTNRLDARQSIEAGARYLADLREQLPAEVKEPDRTWLAMAAYNLGMGHLNGGRAVALMVKRDPNLWHEMKQVLPLLSRQEYAARLKSGAARGGEAVIMVENIRTYYDILVRFESAQPDAQAFSMRSSPPRYGLSAAGTSTPPSAR